MKPLGETQKACLDALVKHGRWPGGWYWKNHSGTVRVLESLVKRGLAQKHSKVRMGFPADFYLPTTAGEDLVNRKGR